MGAAYLAGLAVGYWSSKEDVVKNWAIDKTFEPKIDEEQRSKMIKGWNKAVKICLRLGKRRLKTEQVIGAVAAVLLILVLFRGKMTNEK